MWQNPQPCDYDHTAVTTLPQQWTTVTTTTQRGMTTRDDNEGGQRGGQRGMTTRRTATGARDWHVSSPRYSMFFFNIFYYTTNIYLPGDYHEWAFLAHPPTSNDGRRAQTTNARVAGPDDDGKRPNELKRRTWRNVDDDDDDGYIQGDRDAWRTMTTTTTTRWRLMVEVDDDDTYRGSRRTRRRQKTRETCISNNWNWEMSNICKFSFVISSLYIYIS